MDVKAALKSQYLAGLAMLRQAIERCPDDLWLSGEHPRNYWRIAYHTIFYTDLYLRTGEEAFVPWAKHREDVPCLWENPPVEEPYTKAETIQYLDEVVSNLDDCLAVLDLSAKETGFYWYPIPKLDHQMMNLRHIQGHVGQLSELLMARGIDLDWKGAVL